MTGFNEDRWNDERRKRLERVAVTAGPTIFERCARAIIDVDGRHGLAYTEAAAERLARKYTRAVIQTIIDNTPSLRTAEELTRILGEA